MLCIGSAVASMHFFRVGAMIGFILFLFLHNFIFSSPCSRIVILIVASIGVEYFPEPL